MGWAKADPRADLRSSPLPPPQDGNHGLACSEADMAAGYAICRQAFEGQALVAREPRLSVLWHTHDYVIPPARQCLESRRLRQALGPWLLDGDDFSDGSWNATEVCADESADP